MTTRVTKNAAGSGAKPSGCASGVAGSTAPTRTIPEAASARGRLGRLRKNGMRLVRMAKITSVCVARDSTNQPVRN